MNLLYLKTGLIESGGKSKYLISIICVIVLILNIMSQNVSNNIILIMLVCYSLINSKKNNSQRI